MLKIHSKINPNIIMHIIKKKEEIGCRENISPNEEFLQVSCFKLENNQTFKAHKHISCEKKVTITQESWIVIQGKVKAFLYDFDHTILKEIILEAGDCSITYYGGHNYLCLENNTLVYEFKNGPYFGQEKDKEFI